jgi:hypothetical protein
MGIYAIHAPEPIDGSHGLEQVRAVKSGFSFGALVFGPAWLLARGLWIELAVYAVAVVLILTLAGFGLLAPGAVFALLALAAVYLGFEGHALRAASLDRAGRPAADVLLENGAAHAERAYLVRALARSSASASARSSSVARADSGIIGLFPERGR